MSLQGVLAALFAAGTIVTTLNTYGLPLLDPSKLDLTPATVTAALPGTLAFFALLGKPRHNLRKEKKGKEKRLCLLASSE